MSNSRLSEFESRAREPRYWQEAAREFAVAANYLGDWYDADVDHAGISVASSGYVIPMMLLYAISVENLLKAIKVARGQDPVTSGRLSPGFSSHDLIDHARSAAIPLTPDEEELLAHLRDLIESGKYPVAKSPSGNPTAWNFRFPEDLESVWSLLEKLEERLIASGQPTLPKFDFRTRYRPVGYPKP